MGARFKRRFQAPAPRSASRLAPAAQLLRAALKKDVLRSSREAAGVVPVALENEKEYRLAERDVIAWLQEQPIELGELEAKVASTLRAERLAQLNTLRRLAALAGSSAGSWRGSIDFLESEEPLVVVRPRTARCRSASLLASRSCGNCSRYRVLRPKNRSGDTSQPYRPFGLTSIDIVTRVPAPSLSNRYST